MTETAFQRLLPDDQDELSDLLADLKDLEDNLVPDEETLDDLEGWEISLTFTELDVPQMVEEIEEVSD